MKCPLKHRSFFTDTCNEEDCVWWDEAEKHCYIKSLVFEHSEIAGQLRKLVDKMPHAGQFTK